MYAKEEPTAVAGFQRILVKYTVGDKGMRLVIIAWAEYITTSPSIFELPPGVRTS